MSAIALAAISLQPKPNASANANPTEARMILTAKAINAVAILSCSIAIMTANTMRMVWEILPRSFALPIPALPAAVRTIPATKLARNAPSTKTNMAIIMFGIYATSFDNRSLATVRLRAFIAAARTDNIGQ